MIIKEGGEKKEKKQQQLKMKDTAEKHQMDEPGHGWTDQESGNSFGWKGETGV